MAFTSVFMRRTLSEHSVDATNCVNLLAYADDLRLLANYGEEACTCTGSCGPRARAVVHRFPGEQAAFQEQFRRWCFEIGRHCVEALKPQASFEFIGARLCVDTSGPPHIKRPRPLSQASV